jgi:DtxR family Mn-dependent transcriptional regulator
MLRLDSRRYREARGLASRKTHVKYPDLTPERCVPSLTIENYVKTIYLLCDAECVPAAATGKVAAALAVSPGTVTSMLKTLKETSLAEYTPYEGVRLTDAGRRLALRMLRRHRLIELFLSRTLKLSWDEVHDEAENMEHAVSDLLVDRIDEYLGFPASDPHGDPIPKADGTVPPAAAVPLATAQAGQRFRIERVLDQSPEFLRYLSETGLPLGTEGEVITHRPESGVITLGVDQKQTTLASSVAEKLMVRFE